MSLEAQQRYFSHSAGLLAIVKVGGRFDIFYFSAQERGKVSPRGRGGGAIFHGKS